MTGRITPEVIRQMEANGQARYEWVAAQAPDEDAREDGDLAADYGNFEGAVLAYLETLATKNAIPEVVIERLCDDYPDGEYREILEPIFAL
ncbi:MAG: hypothetical protein GX859_03605 [Corynebacterium humireducens]|jgi:hypothetical protein|uniref:Uncharacterized protein n=1 Tax=Corynebacterium humireducens TaxID=1223514 RepID=A0A7X6PM53_9CORY|nr:hypothetical protein [Corynebacterium humireducens]